ncbi:hypothetical protein KAI58_04780 [Candidatus Gracilibacteria bacterium]|nr:hypothetical protein [Candidatus Gracilibacteria bacterium]
MTEIKKDPKQQKRTKFQSLLLPRAMFKSSRTQLIASLLFLFILGMQLYIFIGLIEIIKEVMNILPLS